MSLPDVVVVGGGVIGCALARKLALAGARVTLLERDEPGAHASWAAAGMLSPLAEADEPGPFLDLLRDSRALYPDFARTLEEETGIAVGYRTEGSLFLALAAADERTLQHRYEWQSAAGLPVERLTGAEALRLEPALAPATRAALRFPEDHQVDNRLLARALPAAARAAGAEIRIGVEARRVRVKGRKAAGVVTAVGERIDAGAVVVAAGSWAGTLAGLPRPVPVFPVHGQLLALGVAPPPFGHVVHSPRVYLVPRAGQRVIAGATVERIGYEKMVTAGGLLGLLAPAIELVPSLRNAPLVESWSGLRPGTPDDLPILGADPEVGGLFYATGHYRNGILLAPVTADLVAGAVLGEPSPRLEPFSIARF